MRCCREARAAAHGIILLGERGVAGASHAPASRRAAGLLHASLIGAGRAAPRDTRARSVASRPTSTSHDIPVWPFLIIAGNTMLTTGDLSGMFTALPTHSGSCTHGWAWAFVPLVGPAIRIADFGPGTVDGSDCTENRGPIVAVAIVSEALQLGAIAAYTTAAVLIFRTEPFGSKKTSFMVTPGVAGAPMGATLSVVSF